MAEHDRDLVATIADAVRAYVGVGSPNDSDAWEYMTYSIPAADAATMRDVWEKGLNDLGRQGWEAVGTVAFPVTVNRGLGPQVERTDALLLKRSTAPG